MNNAILNMRNSVKGTGRAPGFIRDFCREHGISDAVAADVCIVLDELLPNLVAITSSPRIRLEIMTAGDCVKTVVTQSGEPYDIAGHGTISWPQAFPETKISELSLHLIRSLTDDIVCSRINGENTTVFVKRIV